MNNPRINRLLLRFTIVILSFINLGVLLADGLNTNNLSLNIVYKQLFFFFISFFIFKFFSKTKLSILNTYSVPIYILSILSLGLVFLFGKTVYGAKRWIDTGFLLIQPSEFVKFAVIILVAAFYHKYYSKSKSLVINSVISLLVLIPTIAILLQPDLGTSLSLIAILGAGLLASRLPRKYFLAAILFTIVIIPVSYPKLSAYQQNRIDTFLNPANDLLGTGYNINQARIAIGNGGLLGQGINSGSQSNLNFLPSKHTDFIFAVISEKLGLLGSTIVIMSYSSILYIIYFGSKVSRTRFEEYLLLGIFTYWLYHALINIGMNLGLMPVTGLPLPILSIGGSNLFAAIATLGITDNILRRAS